MDNSLFSTKWTITESAENRVLAELSFSPGWTQGRTIFGGYTAAAAAVLACSHLPEYKLRTMQAQLLAPIVAEVVNGELIVLRRGRTMAFCEVRIHQDNALRAVFSYAFANARESIAVPGPAAPEFQAPEKALELPYLEGLTPEFTKHLEYRFCEGGIPFRGGDEASFGGYVRFRKSAESPMTISELIAMLDTWPCPTLCLLNRPVPGSTATWTAHLIEAPKTSASDYYKFRYRTLAAKDGFSTVLGQLWDQSGKLVAFSEQTSVVFD